MRFSMLYSREQILSFKSCLVFYAGDSLNMQTIQTSEDRKTKGKQYFDSFVNFALV